LSISHIPYPISFPPKPGAKENLMLIGWQDGLDFTNIDSAQVVATLIVWMMAALSIVIIIFAILMVRQSTRMANILPTPITPLVKSIAIPYLIFTILVLGLIVHLIVL